MKKRILLSCLLLPLLVACTGPKPLYSWNDYQERAYNYVKNSNDENLEKLLTSYERMVENPGGVRKVILCVTHHQATSK